MALNYQYMRKISILIVLFLLGGFHSSAQNSNFSTADADQCPGNLFTLSADDNSLLTYSWTITEQGGGSSTYNVNPIAFVLSNPGNYDVSLTVSDGVSSSTTTEIGFLEVYDIPTIDYTVSSAPYCEPATVDFTSNSTPGSGSIVSYQLFTDGSAYNTANASHTYATAGTYSVNVAIENSNGCSNSADLSDIVVSINPALTSPLNPNTICSGSVFNYTPTSSIPGSTFSWVRLTNTDISEAPTSGNGNISETLTNTSGSNVSVTYEVTTVSPTGCSVTENVIVTVQALPTVTINSLNICTGSTGVLTAIPSVGGGNYSWSTTETTQSITVSTAGNYTVNYSVGSCASLPASVTVTESAPPVLTGITIAETSGLTNDDGAICKLDDVTLTAEPSGLPGTYSWSSGGSTSSITVSPGSTTTYSVTYSEGGCTSAALSETITVSNLPSTNYDATVTNGCIFPPFNPDISTNYTTTSVGTISWQFPGGTPSTGAGNGPITVTYDAEGIYDATITVVSAQGCLRTTTYTNTIAVVNGLTPTSIFNLTNVTPQCLEGNEFCFEFTGINADTIEWDFGDGSPTIFSDEDSVVCHTFSSIDTFTVSMIPYTTIGNVPGCSGSGADMEVITLGPQAAFDLSPLDCEDQLNRSFTSTSIGTTPSTQYTWDFGDPPSPPVSGVSSSSHTFSAYSPSNSVPYIVTLTVEDPTTGCPPSSATQDVYAFPNNQADFGIYLTNNFLVPSNEVCLNEELWFLNETPLPQNTSPSLNSIQTQWDWDVSNGYQWQSGSEFRGTQEDLDFNEASSVTSGNISWVPGVYDIAMRNTANNDGTLCYDTVVHSVTVHGVIGDLDIVDTVCIDQVFSITDNSSAPLSSIVQRDWDFDNDGIIDLSGNISNPTHSFSSPGEYEVSLTCTDAFNCQTVITKTVVVREVIASFNVDRVFICDDEEVTVTANNSSSFGPLSYDWSAATNVTPSSSTDELPGTFLFNDEGNHFITLTVTDNLGCSDNFTMDIDVFDVVADGSGDPNIATCFNPPTVVTFTNSSSNNVDPNSIFWDFGNGETSTEASPTTIYTSAGSFDVTLTVSSLTGGCTSTEIVETIEVAGPFGAIAITSPVLDDCSCLDVDIEVTTSDVEEATLLFGDGSFQNVALNATTTITHQYCNTGTTAQTLTPILYISSGTCNGNITANESVTIQPLPVVDNPGNFEYCEGENSNPINFTGNIGSTTYNWTNTNTNTGLVAAGSGDIISFLTANSQATASEISTVTVTPIIDATGCSGTPESFTITVNKAPTVNAGVDDEICETENFNLSGAFGGGASSAQWSGGLGTYNPNDQDMSAIYTPTPAEIAAGAVVFTLTTDDPAGVCSSVSDNVTLTINPGVIVNAGVDDVICSNSTYTMSGSIGGSANTAQWTTAGDGVFDNITNLNAIYTPGPNDIISGNVLITLSTDDPVGPCFASTDDMILSFSNAASVSASGPTDICVGNVIPLTATIGGTGSSIVWSNGGGTFSPSVNDLTPTYTPSNAENLAGLASLIVTVNDPDGAGPCSSESVQVDVNIQDTVQVSAGADASICSDDNITLNGLIGGSATSASWTTSGTGTFDDANLLNATYTPSAADLIAGSIVLTLTTDDPAGPCNASSDDMVLSLSEAATLFVTSPLDECVGESIALSAVIGGAGLSVTWSNGGGSFSPSVNDLTPNYIPSTVENAAGSALLTVTVDDPDGLGPCLAVSDQVSINLNDTVQVSAGADATICSDDIIVLNGSIGGSASTSTWTTSGSGSFDNPGLQNATYTPSAGDIALGSVILTLTTDDPVGPCDLSFDQMTLSFSIAATVNISASSAGSCNDATVSITSTIGGTATSITWSGGSGLYTPNINTENIDYTPTTAEIGLGGVTLTATTDDPDGAGPCLSATDDISIVIATDVLVDAGTDEPVCSNLDIQLNGSFGGAATSAQWSGGNGVYTPNDTDPNAMYTPTAAEIAGGSLTLTLTTDDPAGPCIALSDDVTFTFESPASADANVDGVVCSDAAYTLNGSFAGTASSASWASNGTGSFDDVNLLSATYTPSAGDLAAGFVTLTLTTDDPVGVCAPESDDMILTINEAATLVVNSPITECIGETITLDATIGGSATSVTWSNGGGLFTPSVNVVTPDYTPSTIENTAGSVSLIILVDDPDGAGPCTSLSDQIDISLNDTVQVSAGVDASICSDDDITLNGSIGGSASSASWSTSGTGTFDDNNLLNATYTPSAGDLIAGSIVLTLTTDDPVGPCNATSDDMVLTFSEAATLFVTTPLDECVGETIGLNAVIGGAGTTVTWTNGGGSFSPSVNDLSPNYIPSAIENAAGSALLTVTVEDPDGAGPCPAVSDQVSINLNDTVQVSAGIDGTVCSDDDILLSGFIGGSASSATWSGGSGTFDNINALNAIYTPSPADIISGSVDLILTTDDPVGPCTANFDVVTFTFVDVPTADAGFDQDICADQTATVSGTIGGTATSLTWSSSGTGSFDNDAAVIATYTPSIDDINAGSVTITLTTDDPTGFCGNTTDDVVIDIFPLAVVNAGANQTICSSDVAVLSGTIGGGTSSVTWTTTGTGSFVPDANALNPTYIPSAGDLSAGIITFTLTSDDPIGPCVAVSDQMELSINPEAIVDAGPATEVWCAGQDIQLNGSITGGIITGSWSGGAGIFNPNTSDLNAVYTPTAAELSAGNVILTLTSDDPLGTCGPESDVIEILFSTSAIVSAGVDEVICEGDDIVLNGSVGGSAVSATWSGSTGVFLPGNTALNPTFTPSLDDIANGFVVLTITSNDPAGPCAAQTDEVEITINPAPHLSSSLIDDACSGLSVDYNISSSIPATYTWQAQADNPSLSGESLTSQNSSTIDDILINNTGFVQSIDYVINATADATGCQSNDQIVTINVEVISTMDLPANQAICVNTNTTDVIFSGSHPTLTYDWLNDNPSIGLPASGSGNILSFIGLNTTAVTQSANITVTPILNGCPGTPQTFIIEVYPNSTIDNPADVLACDGLPTSDIIFTGSNPGITYNWTNNNTTIGLANAGSGSILSFTAQNTSNSPITATVTVTPELNACDGDPETFEIIVNPSPEMDVPVDQTICVTNNTADINFTSNVIGTTYSWTNDNVDVGLAASGAGDIPSFTTTNISGLLDTANITVTPSYNGCPGPSVTFQIIVTPILQVDPVGPFEFCGGQDFPGVVFTGNVLNTVYEWTNDNTSIGLPASGTGDIGGFTLINSGTVNQVATISVDPVLTGCTGIIQQFQITVKPVPTVAVLPISQTICHDEPTIPVDFSGNISGASYDWTHSNISIGIGSPGFGDIPTFTAINTGLLTQTSNFTVTPSFNGCTGETEIFSITVEPKPTVFPNPSQEWCSGDITNSILFDGNFGPAGATYNWTNDNVTIGLPASGSGDILSFVAQNPTVDVQTATITVVPTLNGCDGDPETITIIVKPVPTVDGPIPDQPLCVNSASDEVIFTGNLPLTTNYNWTNDNVAIGLPASGTGNIPSFIAQNSGNSVISATITVIPELNGCIGTSETFSITTIDPIPIVDDPADQVHCEGDNTDDVIFSGPNPTTSFIWTNDNTSIGLAASGSGDILSFIADNTSLVDQDAIITVTPEYNGCLGVPQTFTITVKPQPNAFATPENQEHCSGEDSDEIFFTGDLAGTQYDWLNDNVSIGLVGSGIGDIPSFTVDNSSNTPQIATINVVPSFNGCTGDPITATIIVNPISTVVVSGGIDEYCHNDPTIDYIFNGSSGASTYNWVNDNISIGLPASGTGDILSFTATNTDLVNQLATITVEPVLNGCVGTTQVIQILVKPIPTVDPVAPQNICANDDTDEINFEGTMTDTTTFGWTHDNVSIGLPSSGVGNIPSFNANNISQDIQVGNITVTPVLNGCIGTAQTVTITVNPISTVNAISDTVCSGDIVPQIDFIGNNSSSVYSWVNDNSSIGLGTTGTDFIPSFVSNNLGTTTQDATIVITPTVNGCPGINDTIHIVVYPTPIVDPIDPLEYCAEDATLLIPFTGNMAINQYDWVNDNAAIGLSGSGVGDINSFITSNTGTTDLVANITVTPSANGCFGASENFSIVVHPLPDVYAGADTTLCFGQSITLTATGAISYSWDNGVINGVPFNPNSTITYTVIGTDANLCQNTDDITVTYLLDIPPVVDAGPDQAICFTDSVTLIASGDAILYQWNNGVIDGVPFSPLTTNSYVLIGTASNGCIEADTVEVVVNPLPVITANASDDFICDGESTILWGEGASVYVWDQGVTDSVSYIPGSTSTYTVIGYDINGCTDTADIEVIVNPLPDVLFSTDMTYGGCVPFSPTFTDLTNGPSSESVLWVFGNGASSTQMGSVINTYDSYGCYNVTLISTTAEGCTDSLTQDDFVCVNPVIASFYPDVYEQSVINPIFEFTNESENATSFQWFFGDGTESDFVNTTHFYDSYGVYNVALVAMAEDGCTDTAYVAITVNDEVLFYVPNSFTPNGDGLNELFIPVLTAGYDRSQGYEFSVYNRWGEQIFFSDTPGEGWDGTYNGLPSQNGTYIWYVKFKDSMNNLIYNYSDHFNLIR